MGDRQPSDLSKKSDNPVEQQAVHILSLILGVQGGGEAECGGCQRPLQTVTGPLPTQPSVLLQKPRDVLMVTWCKGIFTHF